MVSSYVGVKFGYLVESFEDVNAGLMDGTDDRPPRVHRVADRAHHNGGRSCVEPTRRLVHEDDGGVGHQFHGNREPLSLFGGQPSEAR